jgi:hypothetical protein
MSAPLVAALVRAVVFLLRKAPPSPGHTGFDPCHCHRCQLLRDVEREAES